MVKKVNVYLLVGFLLTLSVLWPLLVAPYFTHHDDVQVIRLFEMNKCILDLQIPCRWVPDLGGLYGYPLFNYYGPLPYYFGEIIYLLTSSLLISAKMMFATSFVMSFIFMFFLGRKLWGDFGGLVSGVFYSFAPYHSMDFYVRGAMGEMWALMLYPAIIWGLLRLREEPVKKNMAILALFIGFLVISHNLSAMIFVPMVIVLFGILYLYKRSFRFLEAFVFSLVLGLSISTFYFVPALLEKNLVHVETTTYGYFSYTEHFKGLKKVLFERSWGYGASIREVPGGERDGLSYQVGWAHELVWVLALIFGALIYRKNKLLTGVILVSSVLAVFSIFMINPRSEFIWRNIEPLKYMQFPWRFLMFVIFFVSLISGSVVNLTKKESLKFLIVGCLVILVVGLNFSYFKPEKFIQTNDKDYLSGSNWDKQIKRSIFDYLPKSAKFPPRDLADKRYEVLNGDIKVLSFSEGSDWFKLSVDAKTPTTIRQSQYYFPNWQVMSNGKQLKIGHQNDLGLISYHLEPGVNNVEGKLKDTGVRTLSNLITILGIVLLLYLVYERRVHE